MTGSNDNIGQSARDRAVPELALKEWSPPSLRKLAISATAGSGGKHSGAQNDGTGTKSGDVSNFS